MSSRSAARILPGLALLSLGVLAAACLRKTHGAMGPFVVGAAAPTATPVPCAGLGNAVDDSNLSWGTYGDASWFCQTVQTYSGGDAAQGGDVNNDEYTVLNAAASGAGNLGFWWKVSSEPNYDFLAFYLDGSLQSYISGSTAWAYQSFVLGAGSHILEWVYIKDGSVSNGSDIGWVDAVTFP